ncbi:MAG: hydrogenase maturation nickel metallochaperone HypA [Elusimicrobia bacterium]|nr:hydrogenase maturation nickel metallochaperone HypA [Elusimicrobiota bacterium]
MHELGIAQELFKIIEHKAREHGLKRIGRIKIIIGIASGIEKEFLEHSLVDHVLPGSIASSAEVEIKMEPVKMVCRDCKKELMIDKKENAYGVMACDKCGGHSMDIISGKDVYVESIEG